MHAFTDATGRTWRLDLTLTLARRLKAAGRDPLDPDTLEGITREPYRRADFLFLILEDQAKTHFPPPADPEQAFGELVAACWREATEALYAELAFFFRRLDLPALEKVLQHARHLASELQTQTAALLDDPQTADNLNRALTAATQQAAQMLANLTPADQAAK